MTLAQRRNRLTTRFSEHIPVVKWRISVCVDFRIESHTSTQKCNKGRNFQCYGILEIGGTYLGTWIAACRGEMLPAPSDWKSIEQLLKTSKTDFFCNNNNNNNNSFKMSAINVASYSTKRLFFTKNNCHVVFKTVSYSKKQTYFYNKNIVLG